MAKNFIQHVYALQQPIADCSIYITDHGRFIAGAGLGRKMADRLVTPTISGEPTTGLLTFLSAHQIVSGDEEQRAWIEVKR